MNPSDAEERGIGDGDIVEIRNERGCCLAGVRITDAIRQGCVFLWTGAWYDPDFKDPKHRDRHGNPNVLTHDLRTSELAQGPAAHSARVEIVPINLPAPPVEAHAPPAFAKVRG